MRIKPRFIDVVEKGGKLIEVLLADWVVFVLMAAGALQLHAEKCLRDLFGGVLRLTFVLHETLGQLGRFRIDHRRIQRV